MADPVMTIARYRKLSTDRKVDVNRWLQRHFAGRSIAEVRWGEGMATIVERGGPDDRASLHERAPVEVPEDPPWMGWED